jgi:hypothetical protein
VQHFFIVDIANTLATCGKKKNIQIRNENQLVWIRNMEHTLLRNHTSANEKYQKEAEAAKKRRKRPLHFSVLKKQLIRS